VAAKLALTPEGDSPPEQVLMTNGLAPKVGFDAKKRVKNVRCGNACLVEYEFDAHGRLIGLKLTAVFG
jgi:hypothetical protein